MSRPIKFRAWCEVDKEMGYSDKMNCCSWDTFSYDNQPMMQFTGLLDKNSVDIYEGDIIKITDQALEEFRGKVVSVVFEMGAFRDSYYKWNLSGKSHTFEVIGNVMENPGLLGGAK